jgi:Holliday junction resolvasome RuvABC endonuclease subunit
MKILGIDQSLQNSGWVIVDGKGNILKSGVIKPKTKGVARLIEIRLTVSGILDVYEPDAIGIEGYSFASKMGREQLGELGGCLRTLFFEREQRLYIVPPTVLKKFVTGKGNANKAAVVASAVRKWNLDLNNEHIIEAYGIARIVLAAETEQAALLEYEQDAIKKVRLLEWGNDD